MIIIGINLYYCTAPGEKNIFFHVTLHDPELIKEI